MDTTLDEIDKTFQAEIAREKLGLKKNILDGEKLLSQIDNILLKNPTNTDAKEQKNKIVRYIQRQEKLLHEIEHGIKPEIPKVPFGQGQRYSDFEGRDGIYNPSISRYFNFNLLLDNYNNNYYSSIFKQFEDSVNYSNPRQAYVITIELKDSGMYFNVYNHSNWYNSIGHISLHNGFNIVGLEASGGVSHYKDINGNIYPIGIIKKGNDIQVYFEGGPGKVFPPEGTFLIQKVNELFKELVRNRFLRTLDTGKKHLSYKEKYLLYKRKYLNLKNKL
jgi:hypothetical protein